MTFNLPYPPSVNHYYRHYNTRVLISRAGRKYRKEIFLLLMLNGVQCHEGKLSINIEIYPPDNRKRDVDNVLKCLLDALAIGGLYKDDSQIHKLIIEKKEVLKPSGLATVRVESYQE